MNDDPRHGAGAPLSHSQTPHTQAPHTHASHAHPTHVHPTPPPPPVVSLWMWIGGAVVVAAAIYWITLPSSRVALDGQCQPDGVAAKLSAAFYGGDFWQSQQTALAKEIELLNALPAAAAHARDQQQTGTIEKQMDRLSHQESEGDAAAREKALADEQRGRIERIAQLVACRDPVAQHLAESH